MKNIEDIVVLDPNGEFAIIEEFFYEKELGWCFGTTREGKESEDMYGIFPDEFVSEYPSEGIKEFLKTQEKGIEVIPIEEYWKWLESCRKEE